MAVIPNTSSESGSVLGGSVLGGSVLGGGGRIDMPREGSAACIALAVWGVWVGVFMVLKSGQGCERVGVEEWVVGMRSGWFIYCISPRGCGKCMWKQTNVSTSVTIHMPHCTQCTYATQHSKYTAKTHLQPVHHGWLAGTMPVLLLLAVTAAAVAVVLVVVATVRPVVAW